MKNVKTLVLSANYEIIGCVSWKRGIELLYRNKVDVLFEYPDVQIHSPSVTINVPSVIRYRSGYKYRRLALRFTRNHVFIRDQGKCQYCGKEIGKKSFTLDHVVPKKYGGTKSWENIVISCSHCNSKKGDLSPEEAGMRLRTIPKRPQHIAEFLRYSIENGESVPEAWRQFIGL